MDENSKEIKRLKPKLKTVVYKEKLSLLKLNDSRKLSITNLETFLSQYQIRSLIGFTLYLSEIWKELSIHSENKAKGINRVSFKRYFPLPGLINIRLFNIFDMNKNNYLSPREFIEGMTVLFSESLNKLIKFTFCFYDFDNDGYINRDDIRIVLSYIPNLYNFEGIVLNFCFKKSKSISSWLIPLNLISEIFGIFSSCIKELFIELCFFEKLFFGLNLKVEVFFIFFSLIFLLLLFIASWLFLFLLIIIFIVMFSFFVSDNLLTFFGVIIFFLMFKFILFLKLK